MNIYLITQHHESWVVQLYSGDNARTILTCPTRPEAISTAESLAVQNRPAKVLVVHDDGDTQIVSDYV